MYKGTKKKNKLSGNTHDSIYDDDNNNRSKSNAFFRVCVCVFMNGIAEEKWNEMKRKRPFIFKFGER